MTDIIIWKLLCYIVFASCSTAYPTRNPIEGYTPQPITAVRKIKGHPFEASCPDGWTLTRKTSKEVKTRCGIDWGRITNSYCGIGYVYSWDTGVYWCENKEGTVTNLVNLTVISRSVSVQELHGTRAPFEEYTANPTAVQKFRREIFVMLCPNHSNWTMMRNTSTRIRSKCEVGGDRRKMYGSVCHITYLYPWHAGLYWCENKDGTVANLLNLTILLRSASERTTFGSWSSRRIWC